jgi:hypothetical protein
MKRLTYTERWLVIASLAVVVAWSLFIISVKPALERIKTLERVIPEKRQMLNMLSETSDRYLALKGRLENQKRKAFLQPKDFELIAYLESVNADSAMEKNVHSMKQSVRQLNSNYSETIVEIEFQDMTLEQLVDFMIKTKSSDHLLLIKSLFVKTKPTASNLLDAVIEISSLKLSN